MRIITNVAAATAALLFASLPALSQSNTPANAASTYPDRLVKIVVPFPPGGPTDVAARLIVDKLGAILKQTVVVENMAGASGRTGSKAVAKAAPDGHTLLIGGTNMNAVIPALFTNLDYDPMKDFAPVAAIATDAQVMVVTPTLPVNTMEEFVAYVKARPGQLSSGSVIGISSHFANAMFRMKTGIDMQFVPYKGGAPSIQDVMGGHIQMIFNNKSVLLQLAIDGQVKPLLVTSKQRWPELPNVPTIIEKGMPGMPTTSWYGLLAPAATPVAIIDKLNAAVNDILRSPSTQASLAKLGIDLNIGSPKDFGDALAEQALEWVTIVKETGIKVE